MEDTSKFANVVKDELILKFLAFLKTNLISQSMDAITPQNQTMDNSSQLSVKYFKNIAHTLPKFNLTVDGQKFETLPEI